MRRLALLLVVVGVALALSSASAGLAANIAPNPMFDSCGGTVPASWSADSMFTAVSCATIAGHTSLQDSTQLFNGGGRSTCIDGALTAGSTPASFSYYTTEPTVTAVLFGALFFTGSNCTGGQTGLALSSSSPTLAAWTGVTGAIVVPAGTSSVSFFLNIQCTLSMGAACSVPGATAYFDDLSFDAAPLAVSVLGLSASRSSRGAVVRWRTTSELHMLGFNVFRGTAGARVRANRRLIRASGRGWYSFTDRRGSPRDRYWLQVVSLDGSRRWYGPAPAREA